MFSALDASSLANQTADFSRVLAQFAMTSQPPTSPRISSKATSRLIGASGAAGMEAGLGAASGTGAAGGCGTFAPEFAVMNRESARMSPGSAIGSTAWPARQTSRCRCGPVAWPDWPSEPITVPAETDSPSDTLISFNCPKRSTVSPAAISTRFPYPFVISARVTIAEVGA